jgi:hypothetical protein
LREDYDFLEGNTGGDALAQKMVAIKELKEDKKKMLRQLNDLSENLEDILAENRILRKMNNIPDNWGCEPQKRIIKLQDRETVFEYKRLVKILQEDNYNLEKERAKLKHQIKQMAIYGSLNSIEEFRDLTPEQRVRLADFLTKLRRGETDDDKSWYDLHEENKNLKNIQEQLETFFRDNKGLFNITGNTGSSTMTEEQRKLMEEQRKMQSIINKMAGDMTNRTANIFPTGGNDEVAVCQYCRNKYGPPRQTGQLTGISTKFDTNLNVPLGGSANVRDMPALQLQLVE